LDEGVAVEALVPAGAVVPAGVVLLAAVLLGWLAVVAVVKVVAPLVFVLSALELALVDVEPSVPVLEEATLDDVEVCANTPPADLVPVEEAAAEEVGEELPEGSEELPPQLPDVFMLCQSPVMSPYVYSEPQP